VGKVGFGPFGLVSLSRHPYPGRMRIVFLSLLSLVLLQPTPASAGSPDASECFLMAVPVGKAPIRRTRPFRKAFHHASKERWQRASRAFDKGIAQIQEEATAFHVVDDSDAELPRLRAFLKRHVHAPVPTVIIQGDDFQFVPLVLLTAARAQCESGSPERGMALLNGLDPETHPDLRRALATLEFASGNPSATLQRFQSGRLEFRERLLVALATAGTGDALGAKQHLRELQRDCIGPRQCGQVRRIASRMRTLVPEMETP